MWDWDWIIILWHLACIPCFPKTTASTTYYFAPEAFKKSTAKTLLISRSAFEKLIQIQVSIDFISQ
jgi:hypothetical protein